MVDSDTVTATIPLFGAIENPLRMCLRTRTMNTWSCTNFAFWEFAMCALYLTVDYKTRSVRFLLRISCNTYGTTTKLDLCGQCEVQTRLCLCGHIITGVGHNADMWWLCRPDYKGWIVTWSVSRNSRNRLVHALNGKSMAKKTRKQKSLLKLQCQWETVP